MALDLNAIGKVVEQYMLDVVTISTESAPVVNPSTLAATRTTDVVYSGKAMIAPMGSPGNQEYGEELISRLVYEVSIPFDPGMTTSMADAIIVVDSARDPMLVGSKLRVTGEIPSTFVTHRRLSARLDVSGASV